MQRSYRCGAQHIAVTVGRAAGEQRTVSVQGSEHVVEATRLGATAWQLCIDGVMHVAHVARVGDAVHVVVGGEVYVLTPDAPGAAAGEGSAAVLAPPQIVAPMPGKVSQVLVSTGDRVAAGDGLVILEAMKMEHRLVAEAPATVSAVYVTAAQMVDAGAVLVELTYD